MMMGMLQGTNLDWYVNDMHMLKESTLKRQLLKFLEWKKSDYS
jgi:hypothetical protein